MELRLPFFLAGSFCLLLALLVEVAAAQELTRLTAGELGSQATPGIAIKSLALIDAILFYNLIWMVLSVPGARGVEGRVQGCITLVLSLFSLIGTVLLVLAAFSLLLLMVALLVAVPFGTIAYLAAWGHFARGAAAATLAIVMFLKIAFLVLLVIAHQGFLKNKGLLVLTGLSLGLTWLIGFVHAFLPIFLVSIGDQAMALVISIVAAIWLLLLLITSLVATIKAILSLGKIA